MQEPGSTDHYETLQVSRSADPIIITKAYRILMGLYHPDNKESGDAEMFRRVAEAHDVLSDPVKRSAYDHGTFGQAPRSTDHPAPEAPPGPDDRPHDERQLRQLILETLYTVRRSRPGHPSVSLGTLVELCACSVDAAQFSLWYLKGKKLIEITTDDEITITVGGVDHVEMLPSTPGAGTGLPALTASTVDRLTRNGHARLEDPR